jgi:lipopolysaccharide export LptBFGC system permease protein LptF
MVSALSTLNACPLTFSSTCGIWTQWPGLAAYEIGFWRKGFYPLSCLVMVVLASFAYLHFRAGGISTYVHRLMGISFFMLNNVFGYIGRLNNWEPWLAAALPSPG